MFKTRSKSKSYPLKSPASNQEYGQVRIIGGAWRGRKLPVLNVKGLRPTGDRIKETLFNWLMGEVVGSVVLDCFAGSGALGLECLSRGAEFVQFYEQNPAVHAQLQKNLQQLNCSHQSQIDLVNSLQIFSSPASKQFDLVFIDPPFAENLVAQTLALLEQNNWLKPKALVYVETAKTQTFKLSDRWEVYKHKITGKVSYGLYRYFG